MNDEKVKAAVDAVKNAPDHSSLLKAKREAERVVEAEAKLKKPSEFFTDINSHGIYEVEALVADFNLATGQNLNDAKLGWLMDVYHGGGRVYPDTIGKRMIGGYEFAVAVCTTLSIEYRGCMGRGFQFRACVEALTQAGM